MDAWESMMGMMIHDIWDLDIFAWEPCIVSYGMTLFWGGRGWESDH